MGFQVNQIAFNNTRQDSQFDIVQLNELFKNTKLHNSLFNFQKNDFYIILFITEGRGRHTIDFTDFEYEKGSILSIRKDQIHKFFKSDAKGSLMLFTDDFLSQFIEQSEKIKSLQLFNELISSPKIQLANTAYVEFSDLISNIKKEYEVITDEFSLAIIGSLLHVLFKKTFRIKSEGNEVLQNKKYLDQFVELQNLIENQCFKVKKVSDYASQMAVSSRTLNNITHLIINKSAKQFINEVIITQIKRLLINTNLSITEIAYESGFGEPTNMYKFFKKYVNDTPEHFRNSNK